MGVSSEVLRRVWGRFPTGVVLITTREPDGSAHGMTANAVCSLSLDPPLVLVSVARERRTWGHIRREGRFGMNFLTDRQEAVARYYAQPPDRRVPPPPARFYTSPAGDVPLLESALASLTCRVVAEHPAGTHSLFVAEVEEVRLGEGAPLLYFQGSLFPLILPSPGPPGRPPPPG